MTADQIGRLAKHVETSVKMPEDAWENELKELVDSDPELPSYANIDEKAGLLLDAIVEHLTEE